MPRLSQTAGVTLGESHNLPQPGKSEAELVDEELFAPPLPRFARQSVKEANIETLCSGAASETSQAFQLLKLSPFGHFANGYLLGQLEEALALVDFSRGEEIPASPFYFVRKGCVSIVNTHDNETLSVKRAGDFINWTAEYQPYKSARALNESNQCQVKLL